MFSAMPVALNKGLIKLLVFVTVLSLTSALLYAVAVDPMHNNTAQILAKKNLSQTGVENPVTAVLLNFRAYDTLLEFAVFLCIVICVVPIPGETLAVKKCVINESEDLPIKAAARVFIPLTILMSGYLLWAGAFKPGGAFQAGALLAGCAVLASLAGYLTTSMSSAKWRHIYALGLSVFLLVVAVMVLGGGVFLAFPPQYAGYFILLIESAATLSIAATLYLCYASIRSS